MGDNHGMLRKVFKTEYFSFLNLQSAKVLVQSFADAWIFSSWLQKPDKCTNSKFRNKAVSERERESSNLGLIYHDMTQTGVC